MLVKGFLVFTITSVIGANVVPQNWRDTKQAISSVNYQRSDVPLSYKYNTVHTYGAAQPGPNPTDNDYQAPVKPLQYRSIQYAPLVRAAELRLQNSMYTKHSNPSNQNEQRSLNKETATNSAKVEKKPLEPRIEETTDTRLGVGPNPQTHFDYVPGRNIEVLRSVNRSPGHNAVYRNYEYNGIDNQNKANYLSQYYLYPKRKENNQQYMPSMDRIVISTPVPVPPTTSTKPVVVTTTKPPKYAAPVIPNQLYGAKHFAYLIEAPPKSQYMKMNTLLLNVARIHNPNQVFVPTIQYASKPLSIIRKQIQAPSALRQYSNSQPAPLTKMLRSSQTRLAPIASIQYAAPADKHVYGIYEHFR